MKQIFVISNCRALNDIAYCSKRIKEYLDANRAADKNITAMVTGSAEYKKANATLKKLLAYSNTLYYGAGQSFYVYHDIHRMESETIVLLLDEQSTVETVKSLMHKPDFEIKAKGVQIFIQREPCLCEYAGEL